MYNFINVCLLCIVFSILAICAAAQENTAETDVQKPEYLTNTPDGFTSFILGDHEQYSKDLSHFLWYHFSVRPANFMAPFPKEYLTLTDMWLAKAMDRHNPNITVQNKHREQFLTMHMDEDGYISCHQHYSHSHDFGWPFPLWTQAGNGWWDKTVGWCFQEEPVEHMMIWLFLGPWKDNRLYTEESTKLWRLENVESEGIIDEKWHLVPTGPSPTIETPEWTLIDAFNCPFIQIRWLRTERPENGAKPYIEWKRECDEDYSRERRIYFGYTDEETTLHELISTTQHSIIPMFEHPLWEGKITSFRICLAPGYTESVFDINSIFTAFDTRHTTNNPIFIFGSWNYFRWTLDTDFLAKNIGRMRKALAYIENVHHARELANVRNSFVGHCGRSSIVYDEEGNKTIRSNYGIGSCYWDLLPFGWDDFYATSEYYYALNIMAELEKAIIDNPDWKIPDTPYKQSPERLTKQAAKVKKRANDIFWNDETGRFYACVDKDGDKHDYGFTFLNLNAIWYDIATEEHAKEIMEWISGNRTVEGDTSTGDDIYHWRFSPRATTLRNIDWYNFAWTGPETIPWGGQVQDGGAVLGFTFFDLHARHKIYGPDNTWKRLTEILDWEHDMREAGGYRAYYADPGRGTMQGGGPAGGLGIDREFMESILLPATIIYDFLGLYPDTKGLHVDPGLPTQCPVMTAKNIRYCDITMDITATIDGEIVLDVTDCGERPAKIILSADYSLAGSEKTLREFIIDKTGKYSFTREGN